jgi:zinc protease
MVQARETNMTNNSLRASTAHALPGPDDILRIELPNGIIVLARENYTSPAVVVDGLMWGGSLWEPVELAGLANFHSEMLTRATAHHSFNDLYEEVESIGASFDVGAGGHSYSFDSKSLAEDLPKMLGLLSEVLREPTFPEDHIEKVRGQILTSLQMRAHNTRQMSSLRFQELCYPDGHPYGQSIAGYPDTVTRITRDDLLNFQQHFGPRGAIIVVVGAIKPEEAVRRIEEVFGDWENPRQQPAPSIPTAEPLAEARKAFVNIPGKTQSDIVLGYPGPARSASDFQAARVANSILGQFGLMGRLGDVVRQQQGLAYYSYSALTGGLGPGPWKVSAGVDPANVTKAVDSTLTEIRRMVEEPVTDEELSDNKSFFKGQLVLSLETNDGVAGTIKNMELYDLGLDYLLNYADQIDAITAQDIQAASARYLSPDAYALAVAGPEITEG